VLTVLTAYFGARDTNIAEAIFLATGVLAFGMTVVFLSIRISQLIGIFQRLSVGTLGISAVSLDKNHPTHINHINIFCTLRNDSQRLMFYRLRRSYHSLGRQTPISDQVDQTVVIIPAFGGIQQVNLATIEKVPLIKAIGTTVSPGPAGTIELEVEYGPERDELEYLMHYKADIQVGISTPIGSKEQRAEMTSALKVLEHTHIKK
jgi:hypothetical protein